MSYHEDKKTQVTFSIKEDKKTPLWGA